MSFMHAYGCPKQSWQICLGCGAKVCGCAGTARGQCPECYRGLLSGYYKPIPCGYKGCKSHAVAAAPRVGFACFHHAVDRGGYNPPAVQSDPAAGQPTPYTQTVLGKLGYTGHGYAADF